MSSHTASAPAGYIDPRGPRFGAAITAVVVVIALLTQSAWVIGAQTVVFALGGFLGLSYAPYGVLYRTFLRPRLGAPEELELEAPPRFAQTVGFGFGLVSTIGFASGVTVLGLVFAGFALVAALLNAVFNLCLGCEVYLLFRRSAAAVRFIPTHRPSVSA